MPRGTATRGLAVMSHRWLMLLTGVIWRWDKAAIGRVCCNNQAVECFT